MATLGRNIAYNVAGQALLLVLGFVATKFINSRLGADILGLYYFSLALSAVGTAFVESGLTTVVVREIASRATAEPEYVRSLVRSATAFFWTAFAVIGVGMWLSAPTMLDRWLDVRALARPPAILALRFFLLAALLGLPRMLYGGILRGYRRFGAANAINIGATVAQQTGTLLLLAFTADVVAFSLWYLIASALALVASAAVAARSIGVAALRPGWQSSAVRRNLRFASSTMVSTTLSGLLAYADRLSLGGFLPIDGLAHYGVASTLVTRARSFVTTAGNAAFPTLAEAHGQGDGVLLMAQYRKVDDTLRFFGVMSFAAVLFAVRPLMAFIFGDRVAATLVLPTALLCLGSVLNAALAGPYQLSLAMGRPEIGARLNAIALATMIPLTVFLCWRFGMPGAGASWVAYHILAYAYFVPRVCRLCLHQSASAWFAGVAKMLLCGTITYGGAWIALISMGTNSVILWAVGYTVASAALSVALMKLASAEFRAYLARLFRQTIGGLRWRS